MRHHSQQSMLSKHECFMQRRGKIIPGKELTELTTYKQWNVIEVANQSRSTTNNGETYKKLAIVIKEVRVGEVLDEVQESFGKVKEHQIMKRIQASEFQKDLIECCRFC